MFKLHSAMTLVRSQGFVGGAATVVVAACLLRPAAVPADMVPFGADDIFDTSEYALGSHLLNVVFIQDDLLRDPNDPSHPVIPGGQVIHWTPGELLNRQQRITNASAFWTDTSAQRHHPAAQLDISVNFVNGGQALTVPDIGGEGSVIGYGDALAQLDGQYANFSDLTAVRHFNHNTRQSVETNWASTVFVKPYNGRASAYVNGPLVNAYEDDSSWTYAHEFGHTFGALDEYGSATTSSRSGYLYAFNTNAANLPNGSPNPNSIPAIMKTRDIYTISDGTINQIGWTDTDTDTIPDILDTFPAITTDTSGSLPMTGQAIIAFTGDVTPLPSPDPTEADYTINTISAAQYRLNGGGWNSVPPIDGLFGGYDEDFLLDIPGLTYGEHLFELRVFNSVDNFTGQQASFFSTWVNGDFNGDGFFACTDVDALVVEIVSGTNSPRFDMTADGVVNNSDLEAWLAAAGSANLSSGNPYLPGDATLDGLVDGGDFGVWNSHKFTATAAWCSGDFNADGFVDRFDFNIWNGRKFSSSLNAAAVAEPSTCALTLVALVALFVRSVGAAHPRLDGRV